MELVLATTIGVLGWVLSKPGATPVPLNSVQSAAGVQPANTKNKQKTSKELLKAHDTVAEKRWEAAQDPASNIVGRQVPFFSSFRKQHTNDDVKQRRMEIYSGTLGYDTSASGTWKHKVETVPMFKPVAQPLTSSGSSGNGVTYDPSRYLASTTGIQNNALPFQQQRVGPGVGVGVNVVATDGFHSKYRVLPPDLGYKRNILEGRVVPGGSGVAAREVDPKFSSKGVPRVYSMERRPLERGRAAATAQASRPHTLVKGQGQCHVDTQEYFGPANTLGHVVGAGQWARYKGDDRPGLPMTNVTGATSGVGAFVGTHYDTTRFDSQQREKSLDVIAPKGDQMRHTSERTFLDTPTFRTLQNNLGYNGVAGHYVASNTIHPLDTPQPTLREQLHDQDNGMSGAAPIVKGPTVHCTNRQLLKEAKRGSQVVNNYIPHAERTDAFRRAHVGDDRLVDRCQPRVAVKIDANVGRVTSHAAAGAMYMNQAAPGHNTSGNRNKLAEVNKFQDFNIAKVVLQGNDLHVSHV